MCVFVSSYDQVYEPKRLQFTKLSRFLWFKIQNIEDSFDVTFSSLMPRVIFMQAWLQIMKPWRVGFSYLGLLLSLIFCLPVIVKETKGGRLDYTQNRLLIQLGVVLADAAIGKSATYAHINLLGSTA